MEIFPLGDSALIVRVREQFEDAPDETLDEVLRVFQLLQRAAIPGVIELARLTPAWPFSSILSPLSGRVAQPMGCLTSSRQEFGARLLLLPGVIAAGPQCVVRV